MVRTVVGTEEMWDCVWFFIGDQMLHDCLVVY